MAKRSGQIDDSSNSGKDMLSWSFDHTNSPCTFNLLFSTKMAKSNDPLATMLDGKHLDDDELDTMDDAVDLRFSNESIIDSGGESEKFKHRRIDAAWAPVGVELACRSVLWMPGVLSNEIFDVIDVTAHCGGFFASVLSVSVTIGVGVFMHASSSMLFLKNDVMNMLSSVGGVSGLPLSLMFVACGSVFTSVVSEVVRVMTAGSSVGTASVLVFFLRTARWRRKWQLPSLFSLSAHFTVSIGTALVFTSGVRTSRSLTTSMSSIMMVRSAAAAFTLSGDTKNLSQKRFKSLAGSSAAVYVGEPKFALYAWCDALLFRDVMLRTNEGLSFFALSMMASIMRSSAVSFNADELNDSSFSALLLLLLFSAFDFVDFVDFDRCELRLKLILLKRISDSRVVSGVTAGGGDEYFSRFDAGGAGILTASDSSSAALIYRGWLKYVSVMVVPSGFIVVGTIVGPHGEYSNSNVGNVDAYSVVHTVFFGGVVFLGVDGGVLGSGRFRDGVVFGVITLLGVKLRTSRKANSYLAALPGVLDAFSRKFNGCGVDMCWFSLSQFWMRLLISDEPSDLRRRPSGLWSRFLSGRFNVPSDRRPCKFFLLPDDWLSISADSARLFTVHFNMMACVLNGCVWSKSDNKQKENERERLINVENLLCSGTGHKEIYIYIMVHYMFSRLRPSLNV